MPGQKSHLKLIELRKQLLLAESELNRVRLLEEWTGLKDEARRLTCQVHAAGSLAALAVTVIAALSIWRHSSSGPDDGKKNSSWISTLLDGARTGASLWVVLKSCFR